jgi:hypothetical protein
MRKKTTAQERLALAATWLEIARRIANHEEAWICNAAERLLGGEHPHLSIILERVQVERERQEREDGVTLKLFPNSSLWNNAPDHPPSSVGGKICRIRFIAAEIRRLNERGT